MTLLRTAVETATSEMHVLLNSTVWAPSSLTLLLWQSLRSSRARAGQSGPERARAGQSGPERADELFRNKAHLSSLPDPPRQQPCQPKLPAGCLNNGRVLTPLPFVSDYVICVYVYIYYVICIYIYMYIYVRFFFSPCCI